MQLHTLLGDVVYKTYRAESAARHSEAAAKHKEQGTAAPGAPQASAPSQVSAHPTASSSTCILTRSTLVSPTGRSADRRGCAQGSQRAQKEELELEPGVGAGAGAGGCW